MKVFFKKENFKNSVLNYRESFAHVDAFIDYVWQLALPEPTIIKGDDEYASINFADTVLRLPKDIDLNIIKTYLESMYPKVHSIRKTNKHDKYQNGIVLAVESPYLHDTYIGETFDVNNVAGGIAKIVEEKILAAGFTDRDIKACYASDDDIDAETSVLVFEHMDTGEIVVGISIPQYLYRIHLAKIIKAVGLEIKRFDDRTINYPPIRDTQVNCEEKCCDCSCEE